MTDLGNAPSGNPTVLTREQARRVDQLAIERYGLPGVVLMENAGRGAADLLVRLGIAGPVVVCCGKGNNGGDGFVVARHLDLRGYAMRLMVFCSPEEYVGDAAVQFAAARKLGLPMEILADGPGCNPTALAAKLAGADWIVDALLGTGARGDPRPPIDGVIASVNSAGAKVLAIDVPSGLDCDTGHAAAATIHAAHTATFVAAKPGLLLPEAAPYVGQLHVLDIGVPPRLIEEARQVGEGAMPR